MSESFFTRVHFIKYFCHTVLFLQKIVLQIINLWVLFLKIKYLLFITRCGKKKKFSLYLVYILLVEVF
jgi:hypothetical protein